MCDFDLYSVDNACYMGKDYSERQRIHSDRSSHGFVFFKFGDNTYTFRGGKQVNARTGYFIYLPKYSTYTFSSRVRGEVYCINLQCNDDVFGDDDPNSLCFSIPLKRVTEVESIYKKVIREMCLKKPYYELTVKSLVYELCSIIFTEKNSDYIPSSISERLSPAVSYINEHFIEQDIKIPYLAEMCNMSENYFRRLFAGIYGMSPLKYINERRINYASEFLKSGLFSVSDVASLTGFDDIGYFSRIYKKITGEVPSETKKTIVD